MIFGVSRVGVSILRGLVAVAVVVSVALLCSTGYLRWTESPSRLLARFNLGAENNVAAWWAGALLASVSLFASDGLARFEKRDLGAARAWVLIAAIVLFFSADEVGSLHERLALWSDAWELGSWAFLIPLGAILGIAYLWAAFQIWRLGGSERRRAVIMTVGFGLLGSVALQEFLEHALSWESPALQAVRLMVEEGTELVGMLILLWIAMANTERSPERPFSLLDRAQRPLGMAVLVLAPVLLVLTVLLPDQGFRGRPIDWLSSTLFLAAAAMAGRVVLEGGAGLRHWAVLLLCGIASMAAVAVNPRGTVEIGSLAFANRALVLGGLGVVIGIILLMARRRRGREAIILLGIALVFLLVPGGAFSAYLFTFLLGLSTYVATRTPDSGQTASHGRRVASQG